VLFLASHDVLLRVTTCDWRLTRRHQCTGDAASGEWLQAIDRSCLRRNSRRERRER
jgi:hypothetical protein